MRIRARRWWVEAAAVLVTLSILFGLSLWMIEASRLSHNADSATTYQVVQNTLETGVPRTSIGGSSLNAFVTWPQPAATVCHLPLIETGGTTWNMLGYHAYLVAYPLALLTTLAPAEWVVPAVTAFGYFALLGLGYLVVRRRGGTSLAAGLFVLLTVAHPIWSRGLMADYYPDRLFVPLGFLLLFLLHDPIATAGPGGRGVTFSRRRWAAIGATALLAASTNDRSILETGVILGGVLVFYWLELAWRTRLILAGLAMLCGLGLIAYSKLFMSNPYVTSISTTLLGNPGLVLDQMLSEAGAKFVVMNLVFFGLFCLFEWRLALVAAAAAAPNMLVILGGIEKYGFYSHYHSQYFAVLTYAAACGTARAWILLTRNGRRPPVAVVGLALFMVVNAGLLATADDGAPLTFRAGDRDYRAFWRIPAYYTTQTGLGTVLQMRYRAAALRAAVPRDASVSTVEAYLPVFYRHRNTTYYPVNIDEADYVVLPHADDGHGGRLYTGAVSYTGEGAALDACLNDRLRAHGYDLDHPVYIDTYVAVLKRTQGPQP